MISKGFFYYNFSIDGAKVGILALPSKNNMKIGKKTSFLAN